jgi:2-methylcitrate dehydratase
VTEYARLLSQDPQNHADKDTKLRFYRGFTLDSWLRTVRLMRIYDVRTRRSAEDFPRSEHLAWKIAEVAADPVAVPADTESMVVNRIIDNAAISAASGIRRPLAVARAQAQAHRDSSRGAKALGA